MSLRITILMLMLVPVLGAGNVGASADNDHVLIRALRSFSRPPVETVRRALDQGADANALDADGTSALHLAVRAQSAEEVTLLLDHGAKVDVPDKQGRTPLMSVGNYINPPEQKKLDVAQILVTHGADVNAVDHYGRNVLSFLIPYKVPRVLSYLLDHKAIVDKQDEQGRTALFFAAQEGKAPEAALLLAHGANPVLKVRGGSPLEAAIHYKHRDIVEAMIPFLKPEDAGQGLIAAAQAGDEALLQRLLAQKPDVNIRNEAGMTALLAAVNSGQTAAARLLLEAKADPNLVDKGGYGSILGETALCMAARKQMTDAVRALIKARADLDASCGAMVEAAKAGNSEIVGLLADAGANVQDRFTGNWRALFVAAESGDAAIVRIVLEHGTPVDLRDEMDSTALMVAAGGGNLDVIRMLVSHKADLEAVNAKRPISDVGPNFIGTPLMWAMEAGQQKAADLLLSLGAKPKTLNSYLASSGVVK